MLVRTDLVRTVQNLVPQFMRIPWRVQFIPGHRILPPDTATTSLQRSAKTAVCHGLIEIEFRMRVRKLAAFTTLFLMIFMILMIIFVFAHRDLPKLIVVLP